MPGILRELSEQDNWEDAVILLPGLTYRRDVSDKKHVSKVNMLEMWLEVKKIPLVNVSSRMTYLLLSKALKPQPLLVGTFVLSILLIHIRRVVLR